MKGLKNKLDGVVDRLDFRHVGPMWEVGEYEVEVAPKDSRSDPEEKRVAAKQESRRRRFYPPLQDPDLFLSFARLASRVRPSERSVLRWIRKYGLLHRADDRLETITAYGGLNQAPILVKDFAAEALEARSALDLYSDLNREGIEGFRKRLGVLRERYETGGVLSEMDRYFVREWGKRADKASMYDSGTFQLMATAVLESFVKDKLEGVRLALWHEEYALGSWADRYRPTQSWECPDLISAVYLQFYLMMTNSLAMHRCENPGCGLPIPATRKNRKFCNPTCRSNMRHYR